MRQIIIESLKLAAWGTSAVVLNAGLLAAWAVARVGNRALRRRSS